METGGSSGNADAIRRDREFAEVRDGGGPDAVRRRRKCRVTAILRDFHGEALGEPVHRVAVGGGVDPDLTITRLHGDLHRTRRVGTLPVIR